VSPTATNGVGSQYTKSLGRALMVLRAFRPERPSLALAEVATAVHLDKATVRRFLLTMQHHGFVDQDPVTRKYALGTVVLEMGAAVPVNRGMREVARPIMLDLADRTGLTVFLGVVSHGEALCVERVDAPSAILVRVWPPGGRIPLNCGAAPRVLLAHLPSDEAQEILTQRLGRLTVKSHVKPRALVQELRQIRARGWDCAVDDVTLGTAALGVPVRDRAGSVLAAMSVAGLTHQLPERTRPKYLKYLNDAAADLGPRLPS
jgi:DNA-binding IclR family transcriptional regulator